MAEITWDTAPAFDNLTRNGYSKSRGISIIDIGDQIFVEGINSRGDIAACRIVIPADKLGDLIAVLTEVRRARA